VNEDASSRERWSAVDDYIAQQLHTHDETLTGARARSDEAGLPAIAVSAPQGKLLHLLARSVAARRILEIGTLGGYSTIWLARALPEDGTLVTCEADPRHVDVAETNLAEAGVRGTVQIRLGRALDSLEQLGQEGAGPFDLVFIDADKPNNAAYLRAALGLSHPRTMVILDNVVREGRVVDAESTDADVTGTRTAFEMLSGDPRIDATAIQTVGAKGYDGFVLGLVR
jgi:predicted O-methyltransferase YrrM